MKLKRLLMASALALSFTVSVPAVAKADPISAAVVAFVGFTGTAAAVATFVVNTALYAAGSWALTKAGQALGMGKAQIAERQAQVTSLSLGETPRELIIGLACTGGTLVDAFNFGGKYGTDTTTRCIALCDHVVDALVGYYVDDRYYPFTADGVQPGFGTKLSIEFRNAEAGGYAPPLHVQNNGGWTLADRMVGITHVWVDTRFDEEVWTQGHPRLRFVVRGLKAYDPRKDAALGYTGPNPHVWSNPATHQFTRNAAVLRYNYQRGIYATGRQGQAEHLLIGRGLSAEEAPPERIIAAANLCDELVDGEARYTANGVISAAQSFIEVEEMFAAAMAGVIVQRDGGVEVEPGQAKAAVVTIRDGDLVSGEAVTFSEFLPDTDGGRVNTVIPRYVSPEQGWKDHGGPPRRNLSDIEEDGGPREMTLPLMLVTSGRQADSCAEIARLRGRLERRATLVLPPDYAEIEEGDWIAWQSDRYHDGATVRYQVTSYSLDEKWRLRLSLEEIASSVYGVPDPIEDKADPPPPPVPVDALQLFGVNAEAITLAGETSTLPAVRFTWDVQVEDTAITAIRAEVRRVGETEAATTRLDDPKKGSDVVTNGVAPDSALECRLVPLGDPTRPVLASNWITVSTAPVTAGIPPEVIEGIVSDVLGQVEAGLEDIDGSEELAEVVLETILNEQQGLEQEASQRIEDIQREAAQRAADLMAEAQARGENIAEVREEVSAVADDLSAEVQTRTSQIAATNQSVAVAEQSAKTYADGRYALVQQNFTTIAAFNSGQASTLQSAKSYTDALKAEAALTYATTAALGSGLAATLTESQSYTNGQVSAAMTTVYTKAQTDTGLATTLQSSKSYTDAYKTEASQTFSTKTERANGDAAAVLQANAYTDDFKTEASLTYATQASLGSGLAATLNEAKSYSDGQLSTAMNTVYTKAQTDSGLATTLQQARSYSDDKATEASLLYSTKTERENGDAATLQSARSYTDDFRSEATQTFATQSSLGGVSATAALALSTAQDAASDLNEARVRLITAASGGSPAVIELYSGTGGGSYVVMSAEQIGFGANTVFDDATDTLQTVIGGRRRAVAWGAPFGANGDLIEWWGPSNIALGAMTTANGIDGRMTTAPGYFNNVVNNPLKAASNRYTGSKTRSGAGSITSDTYTVTASGGVAPYAYSWVQIAGDETISVTGGSSASTAFTTTLALGQSKGGTFACIVTDSGGAAITIIVKTAFIEVS